MTEPCGVILSRSQGQPRMWAHASEMLHLFSDLPSSCHQSRRGSGEMTDVVESQNQAGTEPERGWAQTQVPLEAEPLGVA